MAAPPSDARFDGFNEAQRFAESLRPSMEEAVRLSVHADPHVLADALYPAIGPAIRHAVSAAWNDMVQALSRILDDALSPRGLRWRWESFRTGRPLGEIAYYHSLQFEVGEVLLIHRATGLLLAHVSLEPRIARDNELVSGMLTAIQDFVSDSFQRNGATALEALRMGELTVCVEQGPEALLAGIVRGQPPPGLRDTFRDALERIHRAKGRELLRFEGDTQPFEAVEPVLRECLVRRMRPPRQPSRAPALALLASAAALIAGWAAYSIYSHRQWNDAVAAISRRPGFAVTRAERPVLEGLRDPLAEAPDAVLRAAHLDPARVTATWRPFISLDPPVVLARARRVLAPPEGVDLALAGDVLEVRGDAPPAWIEKARQAAPQVPGVRAIRFGAFTRLKALIEKQRLSFEPGSSRLDEASLAEVERLAGWIRAAGPASVEIDGHADRTGPEARNSRLSAARAQAVLQALVARNVPAGRLSASGAGAGDAGRTVSFRVAGERP
ncbi:MAG: OmpA family protein [Acidobacteriota bacterium]